MEPRSALRRHFSNRGISLLIGILVLVACVSRPTMAQDIPVPVSPSFDKLIGGALVVVPDYEGSDDYKLAGGLLLMYKFLGERYVQVTGNKAFVNVLNDPNWELGVKGVYRLGRDSPDEAAVDLLDDVDDSFELGGFVGYSRTLGGNKRHRYNIHLDITQDVADGHDGYVAEMAAVYWRPVTKAFDLGFRLATNYASDDYMQSFFTVSSTESARSGLAQFDADSGFKDIKIGLMGMLHMSESWHLGGGLFYGRLLGDAADSPVTDDVGSPNQLFAGLSLLYSW